MAILMCVMENFWGLNWNWEAYQLWRFRWIPITEFAISEFVLPMRIKGKPLESICVNKKLAICFAVGSQRAHSADKYGNQGDARQPGICISRVRLFGKAEIRSALCSISAFAISLPLRRRSPAVLKFPHLGNGSWIFHMGAGQCRQKMNSRSSPAALAFENVRCALAQFIHICECIMKERSKVEDARHSLRALIVLCDMHSCRQIYERNMKILSSPVLRWNAQRWLANDEQPAKFSLSRVLKDHIGTDSTQKGNRRLPYPLLLLKYGILILC